MCFLNKGSIYFWFIWHIFSFYDIYAQLSPPKLRCVSLLTSTSAVLSWETPPIPAGALTEYQIWTSATQIGPFSLVGRVNIPTQTSFTHSPTSVGSQSQYYFLTTTINGTNTSVASDTLRSLFLNLSNSMINPFESINFTVVSSGSLIESNSSMYGDCSRAST